VPTLTQVIRRSAHPHAGSLDRAAELVRAGKLPLGALAAAASQPYASMLIEQSCGPLYAVCRRRTTSSPANWQPPQRRIKRGSVAEASTLAVITLLPRARADAPVGIHRSQAPAARACGHRSCLERADPRSRNRRTP